jgi:hypothetical protein
MEAIATKMPDALETLGVAVSALPLLGGATRHPALRTVRLGSVLGARNGCVDERLRNRCVHRALMIVTPDQQASLRRGLEELAG